MRPSLRQRLGIFAVVRIDCFIFGLTGSEWYEKTIFEWRAHIKFCAFWVDVPFLVPLPLPACLSICFVLCMSFRRTSNLTYCEVKQLVDFHTRGGRCDFWIAPGWRAAPSAQAISVLLSAHDPHAKFDPGVAETRFFVTLTSSG